MAWRSTGTAGAARRSSCWHFRTLTSCACGRFGPRSADLSPAVAAQLEIDARYASYVRRQDDDVAALRKDEGVRIPADFDFSSLPSLSNEVRQKLERHRPATLAQAGRIDGMTPAGLTLLLAGLKKQAELGVAIASALHATRIWLR